jgi:hypothetical protein
MLTLEQKILVWVVEVENYHSCVMLVILYTFIQKNPQKVLVNGEGSFLGCNLDPLPVAIHEGTAGGVVCIVVVQHLVLSFLSCQSLSYFVFLDRPGLLEINVASLPVGI